MLDDVELKRPWSKLLNTGGKAGTLLGPLESAGKLFNEYLTQNKWYSGPEVTDEGMTALAASLTAWKAERYLKDKERGYDRSPVVQAGRALEAAGSAYTAYRLQMGDGSMVAYAPAVGGITLGALSEYVLGPVHEKYDSRYDSPLSEDAEEIMDALKQGTSPEKLLEEHRGESE